MRFCSTVAFWLLRFQVQGYAHRQSADQCKKATCDLAIS